MSAQYLQQPSPRSPRSMRSPRSFKSSPRGSPRVAPTPRGDELVVVERQEESGACMGLLSAIDVRYIIGLVLVVLTASGLGHQISHFVSAPGTISLVSLMAGEQLTRNKLRSGRPLLIEYLVLASFACSWLFAFVTMVIGLYSMMSDLWCRMSLWVCAWLYATNKLVVYMFLMAKVHLVSNPNVPHLKDPVLRLNVALLLPYGGILVAMLLFDVHVIKEATCFIGLQRFSSVPLIIYDAIFSAYLTVLFLLPILKLRKKTFESEEEEQDTAKLFAALRKNLFAAMISVTVSFGNILALVLFYNGLKTHECWSCCMVDVLVNSLVVNYMSSSLNDLSKTGAMAHELAEAASRWELDRLKFLEQIQAPNRIQLAFITIYQNLKLYRPFIPEAVLQFNNKKSDSAEEDDEDHIEEDVTLVFTDIQNSTSLWESCGPAMRKAVKAHHTVMRKCIADRNGYEVKTEGDAFMVAFTDPAHALGWCIDAQKALLNVEWPAELLALPDGKKETSDGKVVWNGVRVRMGAHFGRCSVEVDPTTNRKDYYGPMVNMAARVSGLPVGGQVVCSAATFRKMGGSCEGAELVPCGMHKLKGITEAVDVYVVIPKGLEGRALAPPTAAPQRPTSKQARRASKQSILSMGSTNFSGGGGPTNGMKISNGVLMLAKVVLPNTGAGDMGLMVHATNELVASVLLEVNNTKGVVDVFGPGWVVASWNVVKRAQLSNAVNAAHAIVKSLEEPLAGEGVAVRVALWQGDVASGPLGAGQRKMIALAGDGINEVQYLGDLASVLDVKVVCNQKLSSTLFDRAATRPIDIVLFPNNPVSEKVFAVEEGPPLDDDPLAPALRLLHERNYEAALNKFQSYQLKNPNDRHAAQWVTNLTPVSRIPERGYARKVGVPRVEVFGLESATALAAWKQDK